MQRLRDKGEVLMRGRWSLAIVGLILIFAGGLLAHLTQTSGGIRIQDVGSRAQGQHHERPALHPAERDRADPCPRHSRRARLHQFARDPGRLCHRIRTPRLCRARARPDRPRLQRPAGLCQRLWRARRPRLSAQPRFRRQEQHRPRRPLDGRLDRARRRHRHAQRLQVDGAGGLVDRHAVRRRRHTHLAAQRGAGVRPI